MRITAESFARSLMATKLARIKDFSEWVEIEWKALFSDVHGLLFPSNLDEAVKVREALSEIGGRIGFVPTVIGGIYYCDRFIKNGVAVK